MKFLTPLLSGLCLIFYLSTASAWEPSEPEGAVPLNAEQIKNAVIGRVAKGQDVDYVDKYFEDGRYKGSFHDEHFSGKWWVEEKDDYLCLRYLSRMRECFNIARDKNGRLYYYKWGSNRPDFRATLEYIKDSD